jgi:hypothetical protein
LSDKIKNEPINFVKNAMVCGDYALTHSLCLTVL